MANVWARLGNGDRALETLNILARSCLGRNLFTYHNDWRKMGVTLDLVWGRTAPFQMDANFGISAAISEMRCGSNAKMLKILPALPSAWETGEFHDMLTRTGVRTSVQWDRVAGSIDITVVAERDTVFVIKFPSVPAELHCSRPEVLGASAFGANYRSIRLLKGETLELQVRQEERVAP